MKKVLEVLKGFAKSAGIALPLLGISALMLSSDNGAFLVMAAHFSGILLPIVIAACAVCFYATYVSVRSSGIQIIGAILFYLVLGLSVGSTNFLLKQNKINQIELAKKTNYSERNIGERIGHLKKIAVYNNVGAYNGSMFRLLLLGGVDEVMLLSRDLRSVGGTGAFQVVESYKLAKGAECRYHSVTDGKPTPDHRDLQSIGRFFECKVITRYDRPQPVDDVYVMTTGADARRAYGRREAIAMSFLKDGKLNEVARWEAGAYPDGKDRTELDFDAGTFLSVLFGIQLKGKNSKLAQGFDMVNSLEANKPITFQKVFANINEAIEVDEKYINVGILYYIRHAIGLDIENKIKYSELSVKNKTDLKKIVNQIEKNCISVNNEIDCRKLIKYHFGIIFEGKIDD